MVGRCWIDSEISSLGRSSCLLSVLPFAADENFLSLLHKVVVFAVSLSFLDHPSNAQFSFIH